MEFNAIGFDADYYVATDAPLPRQHEPLWFHHPRAQPTADAVIVRVTPTHGGAWTGAFTPGCGSMMNGVFATPDPTVVLIVAGGDGFLVPVSSPQDFEIAQAFPIDAVHGVPNRRLLLFVTYTEIWGYNDSGRQWESNRIAYDGLNVTEVTDDHVSGLAWSAPLQAWKPFVVNLSNGWHEGGGYP